MSDIVLGKNMKALSVGKQLPIYTGVIIHAGQDSAGNEKTFSAGDSTGYVLEFSNPQGTQAMANNVLANLKLRGVTYQPYEADGAFLDPAAEVGDGVSVNSTPGVILRRDKKFGRLMATDIAAPFDEEINHEYKYEPKSEREFKRESAYTRARLTIAEDSIEAKVSKTSPTGQESFSWVLVSNSHTWYANGNEVMRVNKNGLKVTGEVVATSGVIGGCSIVNGVLKVESANIGSINASQITAGTLDVDRIAAKSITGAKVANSTLTGGSSGNIAGSTITTSNTVSGINTNLGYAANYGLISDSSNNTNADAIKCNSLKIGTNWVYADGNGFLKIAVYGS